MNWLKAFISYGIMLFATVVFCELGLRIFHFFVPSPIFYDSSHNRYRGKPGQNYFGYRLNSVGFNDTEFTVEPDKFRIIGLGDSFAFGVVPYPNNYLSQLEQKLPGTLVFNMGISSLHPGEYYNLLKREGNPLKPNLVLVSFFMGNDFEIPERRYYTYSYVGTLLHYLYRIRQRISNTGIDLPTYCDTCSTFVPGEYLALEKLRAERLAPLTKADKLDFLDRAEKSLAALKAIQAWCRLRKAEMVVILMPDEIQVNPQLKERVRQMYFSHLQRLPYNLDFANDWMHQQLKKAGMPYIDLLEPFRKKAQHQVLYRPNDSHWNIAGNALAAQILADSMPVLFRKISLPVAHK